jgi:pimeloyl-ACP methyl ester carboxylesterase
VQRHGLDQPVTAISEEQFARVDGLDLCYQTFGAHDDPALLMVMGLGTQMMMWDDALCETLADRRLRVIRFDNRDIGRSTILRERGVPTLRQTVLRDRRAAAYSLDEMAADAVGLLDQLDVDSAHVVGASMGGMIAQLIAINHPDRIRSLVSIMSTTGNRRVGLPRPGMIPLLLRPRRPDREAYVSDMVSTLRAIGSERYPSETGRLRGLAERCYERGHDRSGTARQLLAIQTAPDRTAALRRLRLPAAVIHGTDDPLVRLSGGRATAEAIPDARLLVLEGMAHDLPRPLWPQIVEMIGQTVQAAA